MLYTDAKILKNTFYKSINLMGQLHQIIVKMNINNDV